MPRYKRRIHGHDNFTRHMQVFIIVVILAAIVVLVTPVKWPHG